MEKGLSLCTVRVQDSQRTETLYMAYRSGLHAAQLAAAEFGISRRFGLQSPISPESLDKQLSWEPHWEVSRPSFQSASLF